MKEAVTWEHGELYLLDQTKLPGEVVAERQATAAQVQDSIRQLKVRGAPALGIAGAYGLLVGMRDSREVSKQMFMDLLQEHARRTESTRPTAVNLGWALKRMVRTAEQAYDQAADSSELYDILEQEAVRIHEEDRQINRNIARHGLGLIREGMGVLTHCNAGALATSVLGTATAPLYAAHEKGIKFSVYVDETRPLLQGSRLTAWELMQAGIEVILITDSMAAAMMAEGNIQLVIVGTDRVAANGDVANKIGTLGAAVLAKHFGIPFYVACPSSTIDLETPSGSMIIIEERGTEEVTHFGLRKTAPDGVRVRNPAFDVTPHELVTGIITDRGIMQAPYSERLRELFGG